MPEVSRNEVWANDRAEKEEKPRSEIPYGQSPVCENGNDNRRSRRSAKFERKEFQEAVFPQGTRRAGLKLGLNITSQSNFRGAMHPEGAKTEQIKKNLKNQFYKIFSKKQYTDNYTNTSD